MKFAIVALAIPAIASAGSLIACTSMLDVGTNLETCVLSPPVSAAPTSSSPAPTATLTQPQACSYLKTTLATLNACSNGGSGCQATCVAACTNGTQPASIVGNPVPVFSLSGINAALSSYSQLLSSTQAGSCNYSSCAGVCASGSFASISAAAVVAVALAAASSAQ
jgi:hypothetical protein